MWNAPTDEELRKLPSLYSTERQAWQDKLIHQHYFIFGSDWFLAEYDAQDRVFFGFAILNGDLENAEWGYTSLDEMLAINVHGVEIDRDLHWRVRPAGDVEKIAAAYRRQG